MISAPERVRTIAREVAAKHGMNEHQIFGTMRRAKWRPARDEVWHILHQNGSSYPQIGRWFNRHHTSILAGDRRHRETSNGV